MEKIVVETPHGQFECEDISRKKRRELYKKVKEVSSEKNIEELHDLADEFTLVAFGDEEKAEKALGKLTALQEDEVLNIIIAAYMGFDLGNPTGD